MSMTESKRAFHFQTPPELCPSYDRELQSCDAILCTRRAYREAVEDLPRPVRRTGHWQGAHALFSRRKLASSKASELWDRPRVPPLRHPEPAAPITVLASGRWIGALEKRLLPRFTSPPFKPSPEGLDRQSSREPVRLVAAFPATPQRKRGFASFYPFEAGQTELSFRTNFPASLWASRRVAKE